MEEEFDDPPVDFADMAVAEEPAPEQKKKLPPLRDEPPADNIDDHARWVLERRQRLGMPSPLPNDGRAMPPGAQVLEHGFTPEQKVHFKFLTDKMNDPNLSDDDRQFIANQRNMIKPDWMDRGVVGGNGQMGGMPRQGLPPRGLAPGEGFNGIPSQPIFGRNGVRFRGWRGLAAQDNQQQFTPEQQFQAARHQVDFGLAEQQRLQKMQNAMDEVGRAVDSGQLTAADGLAAMGNIRSGMSALQAQQARTMAKQQAKAEQTMQSQAARAVQMQAQADKFNAGQIGDLIKPDPSGLGAWTMGRDGQLMFHKTKDSKPETNKDFLQQAEDALRMEGVVVSGAKADHAKIGERAKEIKIDYEDTKRPADMNAAIYRNVANQLYKEIRAAEPGSDKQKELMAKMDRAVEKVVKYDPQMQRPGMPTQVPQATPPMTKESAAKEMAVLRQKFPDPNAIPAEVRNRARELHGIMSGK